MATIAAIRDVGDSVMALLARRYSLVRARQGLPEGLSFTQTTLSALAQPSTTPAGVTLTCYRVLPSGHQRPQRLGPSGRPERLGLELHYLLTAWSREGEAVNVHEQTALAWAMLEIHRHPILDRSTLLGGPSVWDAEEVVHFVHDPLTHDAMFRLWDALQPKYRLSASYCARVVRVADSSESELFPPVLDAAFGFGTMETAA